MNQNTDGKMHSSIKSSYEIRTFYPTAGEFENFRIYIEKIEMECHDMGFAKVTIIKNSKKFFWYFSISIHNFLVMSVG